MGNNIRSSSRPKALAPSIPMPPLADAMDAVHLSVDRFCLLAGVEALAEMMEEDATTVCGARHRRHGNRRGYRWGHTQSEIGYHGGRVKVQRPRVRDHAGKEVGLESWQVLRDGNLLLEWALNLMVLNVSTRKYHRAVRLIRGRPGESAWRRHLEVGRFPALCGAVVQEDEGPGQRLGPLGARPRLVILDRRSACRRPDVLVAAIGVDGNGDKHVLAVVEGATENTVVVQALIDNLLARGLESDTAAAVHRRWREGAQQSDPQGPSVWPPPSRAARSTRAVTFIERAVDPDGLACERQEGAPLSCQGDH